MKRIILALTIAAAAFAQSFPGSIYIPPVARDNVATTLSAAMGVGDNVAVVASGTGWVVNSYAYVCDGTQTGIAGKCTGTFEIMKVTATSGNVLTVTRGQGGTSAVAHAAGRAIFNAVTSPYVNVSGAEIVAIETALGINLANVLPPNPMPVNQGGTGAQTAAGARANLGVPPITSYNVEEYRFPLQSPGGSLSVGSNTIPLAPVPLGVNGTDVGHRLYISGGTGASESCLINGGSGTGGQPSGFITISCANTHSGAWTVQSATGGWQEAAQAAGANGSIYFPPGTRTVYGAFTAPYNGQTYWSDNADLMTLMQPNGNNLHRYSITGAASDLTFLRLGWDGNFINQTYTSSTLNTAIDATGSIRAKVIDNKFHAFGDFAGGAYAQVISFYTSRDCEARGNRFYSNMAIEINVNGTTGCSITGNTLGSPNLSDSKTNMNYWDTYSGGIGTFVALSDSILFTNNRMFGTQREFSGGVINAFGALISVDGSGGPESANVQIQNNFVNALGNGVGTVSVTNGSGTINGTNTLFNALDPHRRIVIEGDTTVYTISAYSSPTSITVTPVIARGTAGGLRFQGITSGDLLAVYNVLGLNVSGNQVLFSGDNGMDIAASGGQRTDTAIISNNNVKYSQVDGVFMGGNMFNSLVSGNIFNNNGQKSAAGHQACIELSPTNQGQVAPQPMWHITFDANVCVDDQNTATQVNFFAPEDGQESHIIGNTLAPSNHFYVYAGTGTFFPASSTPAEQAVMFFWPAVSSPVQLTDGFGGGYLSAGYFCGATSGNATCTNATGATARTIGGIATLASNSAVISGIVPAFTSTSTFSCVANDITTRANPVQVVNTSATSITITNTTGAADVIAWHCVGY